MLTTVVPSGDQEGPAITTTTTTTTTATHTIIVAIDNANHHRHRHHVNQLGNETSNPQHKRSASYAKLLAEHTLATPSQRVGTCPKQIEC